MLSFLACNLPSTLSIKCILILSRKHERISGQVDNKNLLHSVSGRFAFQPSLLVGVFNRVFDVYGRVFICGAEKNCFSSYQTHSFQIVPCDCPNACSRSINESVPFCFIISHSGYLSNHWSAHRAMSPQQLEFDQIWETDVSHRCMLASSELE